MHLDQLFAVSAFPSLVACGVHSETRHAHRPSRIVIPVLFALLMTVPMLSQERTPSTPTIAVPTTFAGMSINSNNHHYPPSGTDFGLLRLWDTPGTDWPALQATDGASLSATNLDQVLKDAYNNSPSHDAVVMYTFGRTPSWASANSGDTTCAYANGECQPPSCNSINCSHLNNDGSGDDAPWRAFITDLATHFNNQQTNTPNTYAHVKYFETWNEVDRSNSLTGNHATSNVSYNGTYAQLLRLTEDMRCILLGTGTIHNYPSQNSSTTCSSTTWTGQSVGLMPGVMIVSPSSHAQGSNYLAATSIEKNFLHCDVTGTYAPPAGSDCNWTASNYWGSSAVDIINFHMKPGNEDTSLDPETEMANEYSNATAVMESHDPTTLWNGEAGYSGNGWTPGGSTGDVNLAPYPGQQAAFVGRYMLIQWSLGIQNFNWYQWDNSNNLESGGTTTDAGTAYSTVANWMLGSTMSSAGCAVVSGTLWSCSLKNGTWKGKVFWDVSTSDECHGSDPNPCTTYSYSPGGTGWNDYQTAIGSAVSISPPYSIPVSNMPVIIETGPAPKAKK
jgi:hypothetical protein